MSIINIIQMFEKMFVETIFEEEITDYEQLKNLRIGAKMYATISVIVTLIVSLFFDKFKIKDSSIDQIFGDNSFSVTKFISVASKYSELTFLANIEKFFALSILFLSISSLFIILTNKKIVLRLLSIVTFLSVIVSVIVCFAFNIIVSKFIDTQIRLTLFAFIPLLSVTYTYITWVMYIEYDRNFSEMKEKIKNEELK